MSTAYAPMTDAAKVRVLLEVYKRAWTVLGAGADGNYGPECASECRAARSWIAGLMDIEPAGEWPEGI